MDSKKRYIALVDMDGVLCDYYSALKKDYNKIKSPSDPEFEKTNSNSPLYLKNRVDLIRNQQGWWEKLKPLKRGFEILKLLKKLGYEINILTKAPRNAFNANTEKSKWIEKHVGKIGKDVFMHISSDKSLAYGRVLIDDYPPYIEPWLKARPRGIVIMPPHPWNKNFKHKRVIRYTTKNLKKAKKALIWARDRK